MSEITHPSAMVAEVLEYLKVESGGVYLDSTEGGGGHTEAILEASGPDGAVIGVDLDREALKLAADRLERFGDRVRLLHGRFSQLERAVKEAGALEVDGVLADLGPSRIQLLSHRRGFSFDSEGKLDARMDRRQELTAWDIVNRYPRRELLRVLALTGKRREAGILADAILARRAKGAIETPRELAEVVRRAVGREKRGHVDASTEWLMALRMHVNREIEEAEAGVESAAKVLRPGGRIVVISWDGTTHRAVRQKMRALAKGCICPPDMPCVCGKQPLIKVLTPNGINASEDERKINPATRTCRLFAAEVLETESGRP
jgi:16S rRNA (cytosine1402-N4)-methyltransferase